LAIALLLAIVTTSFSAQAQEPMAPEISQATESTDAISDSDIDEMVQDADRLVKEGLSKKEIDDIVNAEQIQTQKQLAFNNNLLWEFDYSQLSARIPVFGIYNSDVMKICFGGAELFNEWLFYKRIIARINRDFLKTLMDNSAELLNLLKTNPVAAENFIRKIHATNFKDYAKNGTWTDLVWHAATSMASSKLYEHLKLNPDKPFLAKPQKKLDPPPVFSFVEKNPVITGLRYWLKGGIWDDIKKHLKNWGADWSCCDSTLWQLAQHITTLTLFIHSENKTIFSNFCAGNLVQNRTRLIEMLEQLDKFKKQSAQTKGNTLDVINNQAISIQNQIQKLVCESHYLSFPSWLMHKNIQCAKWQAIFSFMTTLPIWGKFIKCAFKIVKDFQKSCNVENPKDQPVDGVQS